MKENNQRLRYLSKEEIGRLLAQCKGRPHLHSIVLCALNTGMRRGEILSLHWNQIKDGAIYLEKTKTNEPRQIPVNDDLEKVFKEIRREKGLSSPHVFTMSIKKGKREETLQRIDRSFTKALKDAKIEDCRFHDLRHTFASHLIMNGASLKEVQELLGHKTMTMTLRYAHLSAEHKKKAVNLLNGLTAVTSVTEKPGLSQNVTF